MISIKRKRVAINVALVLISILFSSMAAMAAPSYQVTSGDDSGPGTLRDALGSGATVIVIDASVSTIAIDSTLFYNDEAALKIVGSGQIVDGGGFGGTLLEITEGADLTISNLDFMGAGGFDVDNQGGGKGIFVDVPLDRTGIVSLTLTNVAVTGVGLQGIHVLDCDLEGCDGSAASIHVSLTNVTVDDTPVTAASTRTVCGLTIGTMVTSCLAQWAQLSSTSVPMVLSWTRAMAAIL